MIKINGISEVANASKNIVQRKANTWLDIYYNVKENKIIAKAWHRSASDDGEYYFLTTLIRECSENEIAITVRKMMCV